MQNPADALQAVTDAVAVLTWTTGELDRRTATIGELTDQLHRLSRAVARAQVVATVTPEALLHTPVRGCFVPDDAVEHAADRAVLDALAALPSGPVVVTVRVERLDDGSAEDALRSWLNGQRLRAVPAGTAYEVDGRYLASMIAERFLPIDL